MMKMTVIALKALKKIYKATHSSKRYEKYFEGLSLDAQETSDTIAQYLTKDEPCMIARFGSTELSCICNYSAIKYDRNRIWKYVKDDISDWWWNESIMNQMQQWSGFFPPTEENLTRFSEMMFDETSHLDILASWVREERKIQRFFPSDLKKIKLILLEPFWAERPWTQALSGKKVLVVHPFASQIERQYRERRSKLFKNPMVLPEFELMTIEAVQSLGGDCCRFKDWFDALDWMKSEMDKIEYDIALIGCGAYGFPLAAYAKRTGHKAVHLAGSLQLLFGIKGKRWENPHQGESTLGRSNAYPELFNEYWEYPDSSSKPKSAEKVEGGCYW